MGGGGGEGEDLFCISFSLSGAESHAASIASQPLEPTWSSSFELHHFIQQQRKIISTFRAQPWSMQMKLAALRYIYTCTFTINISFLFHSHHLCLIVTIIYVIKAAIFINWGWGDLSFLVLAIQGLMILPAYIHKQINIICSLYAMSSCCRNYRRNVSKYIPQLNTIDTFRDSSGQV